MVIGGSLVVGCDGQIQWWVGRLVVGSVVRNRWCEIGEWVHQDQARELNRLPAHRQREIGFQHNQADDRVDRLGQGGDHAWVGGCAMVAVGCWQQCVSCKYYFNVQKILF